jgi:glycogen operon protein
VRGEPILDDSFLLYVHAGAADLEVRLPGRFWGASYEVVVDTADASAQGRRLRAAGRVKLVHRSSLLLRVID